jgi:hypothetical protein
MAAGGRLNGRQGFKGRPGAFQIADDVRPAACNNLQHQTCKTVRDYSISWVSAKRPLSLLVTRGKYSFVLLSRKSCMDYKTVALPLS